MQWFSTSSCVQQHVQANVSACCMPLPCVEQHMYNCGSSTVAIGTHYIRYVCNIHTSRQLSCVVVCIDSEFERTLQLASNIRCYGIYTKGTVISRVLLFVACPIIITENVHTLEFSYIRASTTDVVALMC